MSAALIVPNFGTNDAIKPMPKKDMELTTFCFTDNINEHDPRIVKTWDHVIQPPYPAAFLPMRQRAYYFKQQPHRVDELREFRWLVIADATFQFRETRFIAGFLDQLALRPMANRILLAKHPQRATVDEEAAFLLAELDRGNAYFHRRYDAKRVREQMAWFRRRGLRTDAPLYNAGFIIVENNTELHPVFNDWWDMQMRFGQLDQLGLGVLLAANEIEPLIFPVANICEGNPYFTFVPHA